MSAPLPPSFRQIGDLLKPIIARAERDMLVYEIVQILRTNHMDLTDEARCLQLLIVQRAIDAERAEIELAFDRAIAIARTVAGWEGYCNDNS